MNRGAIVAVALFLFRCNVGCSIGDDTMTKVSPDGRLKAVRYDYSCSSAANRTTELSVVGRWAPISGGGNAFSCDCDPEDVRMMWEGNGKLRVSFPAAVNVLRRVPAVKGVAVEYVAVPAAR